MARGHKYTPEQVEWFHSHSAKYTKTELPQAFCDEFGVLLSVSALSGTRQRHGIKTGRSVLFKKGNVPHNKGKKGRSVSPATEFKKGDIPPNHRPVFTERISKDGTIEIKTAEGLRMWKSKHSYLWENHHKKPVPKSHVVIFADQDKRNFDIDNLVLVSRAELARLNKLRYSQQHNELKPSILATVRLIEKIRTVQQG